MRRLSIFRVSKNPWRLRPSGRAHRAPIEKKDTANLIQSWQPLGPWVAYQSPEPGVGQGDPRRPLPISFLLAQLIYVTKNGDPEPKPFRGDYPGRIFDSILHKEPAPHALAAQPVNPLKSSITFIGKIQTNKALEKRTTARSDIKPPPQFRAD